MMGEIGDLGCRETDIWWKAFAAWTNWSAESKFLLCEATKLFDILIKAAVKHLGINSKLNAVVYIVFADLRLSWVLGFRWEANEFVSIY